jgi:hypothetical protein
MMLAELAVPFLEGCPKLRDCQSLSNIFMSHLIFSLKNSNYLPVSLPEYEADLETKYCLKTVTLF